MTSVKLSLEDINELIKHFALQIQDRIQELHKKRGLFFTNSDPHLSLENNQSVTHILSKYSQYQSSQIMEVKIIKKFTQRILQIFQFFRQKYNSHSQNLLSVIENRIKSKLQFFVSKQIIPIGQVLQFAYSLTTKNALTLILKYNSFQKQKAVRQKRSFLSSCSTSVKISLHSQPDELQQIPQVLQRRKQNHTQLSRTQVTKNQLNFERIKDKQCFPLPQASNQQQQRPFTSKENRVRYRRSESSSNQIKNWRKHSITNKKPDTYLKVLYKDKQITPTAEDNTKKTVEIDKLYVNMNLDKKFIEKMLQKKQFLFKDMQKRNQKILNNIKKQQKKQRLETQTNLSKQKQQRYALKWVPQQRSLSHLKLLTENNGNIISQGMNKKQSFRNMIYQNHLQKKKKCLDKKNGNRKSISKNEVINNKENVYAGM